MGMTPPDEELIEAFVKYALIYYCRGVLQDRFDCTEEWKSCAEQVQPWMVERQGPFVSIRQRDGSDRDTWHWVLIPKEDVEEFVRQVTEEAAT